LVVLLILKAVVLLGKGTKEELALVLQEEVLVETKPGPRKVLLPKKTR
jgi:hypothetical protein